MCSLAAKSVLGAVTKGRGLIQCAVLDRRQSSNLSLWVARPAEPRLETPSPGRGDEQSPQEGPPCPYLP